MNKTQKINDNELFITTTDTIIGIGGKVNDVVKDKIYKIKKRDLSKRIVIILGSIEQLYEFENVDQIQMEYINKYWPGPTTLIINGNGYRIPANEELRKFIINEGPFYLTSANISNQSHCSTLEEASKIFPDIRIFDFGYGSNIPSSIIDTKDGKKIR